MDWEPVVAAASLWLAAGMTFANILYRRGHDGWHWMIVCGVAGPMALLFVVDQARVIEPDVRPVVLATSGPARDGATVVVPAAAVGAIGGTTLEKLGLAVGRVAITAPIAFERAGTAAWDAAQETMGTTLAEAEHRFAPHPVELVLIPGTPASIAAWAADHAPAVIVTTRAAQPTRALARLVRVAAEKRGVSAVILDPTALESLTGRQAA